MKKTCVGVNDIAALRSIGLTDGTADIAVRLIFDRGEFLFREGFPVEYLMLVVKGRGKVSLSVPCGKKLLIDFYGAGTVLGTVELPLEIPATTDVESAEKTECVAVPIRFCKKAMRNNPIFAQHVTCLLAQIVVRSSKNAAANILSSLRERLCAYIESTQTDGIFFANYTHLAEMLGVSSRHLFRELSGLCTEGVLKKQERGYRITDPAALISAAADCYILCR